MILAQTNGDSNGVVDTATALLHLLFIVGFAFLLVGGTVAVIVLWYVRGRDPATGMIAEYITEPPDDLPPGAVGTLLDERADHHDVVATLLGLARHGAVQIHEVKSTPKSSSVGVDFELEVVDPDAAESRLERDLLTFLFDGDPKAGESVRLRDVKGRFDAHEKEIKNDLYEELVERGYFERSPDETRRRWMLLSGAGVLVSLIVGLTVVLRTGALALLPTSAAVIVWIVMLRMSDAMPQKTRHGAECAARWRAFRTYLQSIDTFEDLTEARSLFDRYLSYAVAFGIEKKWIASFAAVGATTPPWLDGPALGDSGGWGMGDAMFDSIQAARMIGHLGGGVDASNFDLPEISAPEIGMPDLGNVDLQGMADMMGSGLESGSEGLSGLLDVAGGIFGSIDFDI